MRILIVKLGPLGDVAHALPVVADIRAAHPPAEIDWAVEPAFAPLVRKVQGVAEVIECPMRRWRQQWWTPQTRKEWRAFKQRLRLEPYDAVIDLQGLTESALVARMARGRRYGIANRTDGYAYEAPARWLVDLAIRLPAHIHALDRSRELVARVLGTQVQGPPDFGLQVQVPRLPEPTVVFVHGTSQADKLWQEARWVTLGRRFVEKGWRIALPHGDEMEQVRAERLAGAILSETTAFVSNIPRGGPVVEVWPRMNLGALVDRMAAAHGVVGVDSALSYIAVALDLPHVQLYLHPTVWRTGPLIAHGRRHQVAVGGDALPSVNDVWNAWLRVAALARQAVG